MAVYNVTNGPQTITGGAGSDTLNVTYTVDGGVDMNGFSGSLAAGYSGLFNGPGSANVDFSGIENFGFFQLASGVDNIVTGDGNDTLSSGDMNDVLNSGGGVDVIDGGTGDDTWIADKSFATQSIRIDLSAGTAQTYLGSGSVQNIEAMQLTTGSGNDVLQGTAANLIDIIDTGAGNDTITLPLGNNDTVAGGTGFDTLVVTSSDDSGVWTTDFAADASGYSGWLNGAGNNNLTFSGIDRFNITNTAAGPDIIRTGDGNDTIRTGAGDDAIDSGRGSDVVDGGDGLDTWTADKSFTDTAMRIDLTKAAAQTYFGGGRVSHIEALHLTTGSGDDRITGTAENMIDVIDTGAGDDIITLPLGNDDTVAGGTGDDVLVVTCSDDSGVWTTDFAADASGYSGWLNGAGNNNLTFSGIDRFRITNTGTGGDIIATGAGADTITTGAGDDTIDSGRGADVINGGGGLDYWIADRSNVTDSIRFDLNSSAGQAIGGGGSIRGVDGVSLLCGSGADRIHTSTAHMADSISAAGGNDTLTIELSAHDTVDGGAGRDRLVVIYGTNDVDLVLTHGAGGYAGTFDGNGDNNLDFTGIEDFSIFGSALAETVGGFLGNDSIDGGGGADTLLGGAGKDSLSGGAGKDVLTGGTGKDVLAGGGDADLFVFTSIHDSPDTSQRDVITDFAGKDRIDLSAIDADTHAAGDQAFTFIGTDAFHGVAGELRARVVGDSVIVYGDVNGDGTADFSIQLSGAPTLDSHDFVL